MDSYVTLTNILDQRRGNPHCEFNGFLEDYAALLPEHHPHLSLFKKILEKDCDYRVLVHYRFDINHNLISNQIIRYKDIQKIPDHQFDLPYLIYGKNPEGELCGLILLDGDASSYLLAKGYFLALTEQGSVLETMKNQCVSCYIDHPNLFNAIDKLYTDKTKAGAVQRMLDSDVFGSYEDLLAKVYQTASQIQEDVKVAILTNLKREAVIYPAVVKWFLLKKMIYVHTMMNRTLLQVECENDIRRQRHIAKLNSDHVQFLMYSEMWRM